MKKITAFITALALLFSTAADATIINSLPYNLTNGSLADATQVMGNFNQIVSNANLNAAHSGANSDITSISGLTTPLVNSQGGTVIYTGITTGGTANAQTLAVVTPSNFTLTAGNIVTAIAGATNTGAMTFSVNSTTATAVRKVGTSGPIALTGGEIVSGNAYTWYFDGTYLIVLNPTLGLDGTNFSLSSAGNLAFGTAPVLPSGTTATTQAASDNSTKIATTAFAQTAGRAKTGFFTRDVSTASGTQVITGIGFNPKSVDFNAFFSVGGNTAAMSWGFDDGTTPVCSTNATGSFAPLLDDTNSIDVINSGGNASTAKITAFGADGFTLTWVKVGSPTGTLTIQYVAH